MNAPDRSAAAVQRLRRRLPTRGERRVTYALKVLATIAIALYLLVGLLQFFASIRTTGLLLVGALLLSYVIYPLVRRLNTRLPAALAILIVYLFIILVVGSALALVVPALGNDITNFVRTLPTLTAQFQQELIAPHNPLLRRIPDTDRMYLANLPSQLDSMVQKYGVDTLTRSFTVVLSTFSIVATLVIVPVLAAYMLLEAADVRRQLLGLFPAKRRAKVDHVIDELDAVVGGFIRGQLIDGAIVGAMIFVMLMIMHVPYALLIGVSAGILNFIPYAGAVIGFIPSVLLALAYNGPTNALIVAILFAVIQQIDGNFVAPRVLKDNVGLSPLYIIIAILMGSELFGLVGTFLAVPVAAMLRVLREQLLPSAAPLPPHPDDITKPPRAAVPGSAT
jgi:predicted PurR-regulated permease PerM